MVRWTPLALTVLISISLAAAPCPACQPAQPIETKSPAPMHPCCPHMPQPAGHDAQRPASHQAPAPVCSWLPSEKAPPEAKADAAPTMPGNGAFLPALDVEAALFANVLIVPEPLLGPPPGGTPPAPPLLALSVRC
jgi:hypothetical protein